MHVPDKRMYTNSWGLMSPMSGVNLQQGEEGRYIKKSLYLFEPLKVDACGCFTGSHIKII